MDLDTTIVVPCYNEARRLPVDAFRTFAFAVPRVKFLFVDDGSTDDTARVLTNLEAAEPDHFQAILLPSNRGKAEAVRTGMLSALAGSGRYAGYWDADLATPLSEIPRFIATLDAYPERDVCLGARVQLLGRTIDRKPYRHYVGRVFATVASGVLSLPVYDTQCGAKLFRTSDRIGELFDRPFLSRWIFDVELIARLVRQRGRDAAARAIYELPIMTWHDVKGSKVRSTDFFRALKDLWKIHRAYNRRDD